MSEEELKYDPIRNAYIHQPKNKLVIKDLWAYVSVDPADGNEGILSMIAPGPDGMPTYIPFIGADEARMKSLLPEARRLRAISKNPVRLLKFSHREVIEEI